MLSDSTLSKILIEVKLLTDKELTKYTNEAKQLGVSLEKYINDQNILSETALYTGIAHYYDYEFVDISKVTIRKDILFLVPEPLALHHNIIAYDSTETSLKVATTDPQDLQIFEFLKRKTGLSIDIAITMPSAINAVLKQYSKGLRAEFEEMTEVAQEAPGGGEKQLKDLAQDVPVIRIVDTLLEYAILESASDIHIEPAEKKISVRYRIDGILRNVMTLPKSVHAGIVARIKILSNLKIDEHRLPQDGRFKIHSQKFNVAFRVSVVPTFDGEKIVLRLLNEEAKLLDIEKLGFQKEATEIVQRNISKPHGLILVTGPTGSGKTTTLYSILNQLNKPEVNITTIEDPIEYRMQGINQSQVNPKIGYTFASGLRAYLRQDPDIIMVGEIRDQETAEIAFHAGMTGHLVLSTLHTNDAPGTLPRITEMGIPSFLVASTTNVIIAQRLARKLCQDCLERYTLTSKELEKLEKEIDFKKVISTLQSKGFITSDAPSKLVFYRSKGCVKCGGDGYKGRIGLYEVMEVTDTIKELILKDSTALEIAAEAAEQGMLSILEDGFIKAKTGITSIEEVLRVTRE